MTENMIYNSLTEILMQEDTSRIEKFKKAWRVYFGDHDKPLKVKQGKPDDNVRLNYARVIVDKGVTFLFGKEVNFDVSGDQEQTAPDTWLKGFWKQNRKMSLLQKLALNGGVCGQAFLKIKVQAGLPYPRLIVLDPETVSVRTAADDIDQVVRYLIQYPSKDARTGKPIGVRQIIEQDGAHWLITDQVGDLQTLHWVTVGEETWPWVWPPIMSCQNLPAPNEYWGVSDLEGDIIEAGNAVNFVVSNLLRIIRFHAHPKTWGSGFSDKELRMAVDETIILPNAEAKLQNLEMTSDLESSIEFYKRLKEALHELSRIPEVATGKVENAGALSGVALEILYQPLIEKTETKRLQYGELISEVNRCGLAMGGFGETQDTELQWPEILPKDPLVERQAALIDKQLGVSNDTLQTKLGYDPDLERKKKATQVEELGEQLLGAFDRGDETANA
jgi:hypothetical protein